MDNVKDFFPSEISLVYSESSRLRLVVCFSNLNHLPLYTKEFTSLIQLTAHKPLFCIIMPLNR